LIGQSSEDRYAVQEKFALWGGVEGQSRLAGASAVVVGVGALGGTSATLLVRAGVGRLTLIDPDYPSLDNLHRQILYTEADTRTGLNKAEAAAKYLGSVNCEVCIKPVAARLEPKNAISLLQGADVVLDGLDNMESRYVLNEACHSMGTPWVHAAVVASRSQIMVIRPGQGPCLRCWSNPEDSEKSTPLISVHGVIGPTPLCMAGLQVNEALKILLGAEEFLLAGLLKVELWPPGFKTLEYKYLRNSECPVCSGRYEFIRV
jgi:molybdopterin/thiamine biosynthesis adenylyltransferase